MPTSEHTGAPTFVSGFGLGLLAGTAGFVLFGTKKGEILRRNLQKAFAEAYQAEIAAGVSTGEAVSLRDFLKTTLEKVKEEYEIDNRGKKISGSTGDKRKSKTKAGKTKVLNQKSKFKGT